MDGQGDAQDANPAGTGVRHSESLPTAPNIGCAAYRIVLEHRMALSASIRNCWLSKACLAACLALYLHKKPFRLPFFNTAFSCSVTVPSRQGLCFYRANIVQVQGKFLLRQFSPDSRDIYMLQRGGFMFLHILAHQIEISTFRWKCSTIIGYLQTLDWMSSSTDSICTSTQATTLITRTLQSDIETFAMTHAGSSSCYPLSFSPRDGTAFCPHTLPSLLTNLMIWHLARRLVKGTTLESPLLSALGTLLIVLFRNRNDVTMQGPV